MTRVVDRECKVISWNCRGLKQVSKLVRFLKNIKDYKQKPLIICLQEIKLKLLGDKIIETINFHKLKYILQPAEGTSGGLLILHSDYLKVDVLSSDEVCQIIFVPDLTTIFVNVYIKTSDYARYCLQLSRSTEKLENFTNKETRILLLGDINAYSNAKKDRQGEKTSAIIKKDLHVQIYKKLEPVLQELGVEDVATALDAEQHTHFCAKTKTTTRIDHIFSNEIQDNDVISCHKNNLSDHSWIEYDIASTLPTDWGPGMWRLNNNILTENYRLIEEQLSSYSTDCYDICKQNLRDTLRSIAINKKHLDNKYKFYVLENLNKCPSDDAEQMKYWQCLLSDIEKKECNEVLQSMKGHLKEIYEGKSESVKKWASQSQPKNKITSLKSLKDGRILTTTSEILTEMRSFYKNLYGNEKVKSIARCKVLRCFNKKVSPEAAARLGDDFSLSEVIYAIQRLRNNTSPGPDGLTSELYKQHSSTFGQILKHLFNDALHGRRLPESFKKAVIKVLPKEGKREDVTCFRPISLINSDQKVLAHLIAERLKSVLTNLIGFEQYAYLKNRNISKALLDLKCRMKLSDWDHCVVKIDFAKAFDRVDRPYMFQLLRKMQLPESLIQLIEEIYYKTKSVIGVNGYFTKEVCIHRGVRQGCPLSALLYIIALEPLLIKL